MNQTYIVTGDRGFVGSRLRRTLLARGDTVIGIDCSPASDLPSSNYRPLTLDLACEAEVQRHASDFRSARAVLHLAAKLSATDDDPLAPHIEANLRTTENLLAVLRESGVPLVLSSTMSVFGLPPNSLLVAEDQPPRPCEAYGLTKLAAEYAAERASRAGWTPCVVLRYSGIFGAGYRYGAIHLYASKALAGETVSVYGGGRIVRDYVHVDDVIAANLLAAQAVQRKGFSLYHIGGGQPLPLAELAQITVASVGGGRVEINESPGPFDFAFDISHARKGLGYEPQPLKNRIAQYVADLRNNDSATKR